MADYGTGEAADLCLHENPLEARDGEDDDPSQLRLTFSETVDPLSVTATTSNLGSTTKSSRLGTSGFNPHITVGGTVHASNKLTVGPAGVAYGAHSHFQLRSDDFAPLRIPDLELEPVEPRSNTGTEVNAASQCGDSSLRNSSGDVSECSVSTGNLLGRGASGSVRLMVHIPTGRPVAVKSIATVEKHHFDEILSELRALCDAKALFETAMQSSAPLNFDTPAESPLTTTAGSGFIVDFLGAWSTDGFVNIAMECMAGSLADIGSPPEPIISKMAHMLLKGLSVLHRKLALLHRDLKPGNVLFDVAGSVKVADFGVSSKMEASRLEETSTFIGSIMYMSPERVNGESYSYPSDVWALALTLLEVFLGKHPFRWHLGDAAFHGNHEKKFWKMVELYSTAAIFDRNLDILLTAIKLRKISDDASSPERTGEVQSPPEVRPIDLDQVTFAEIPTLQSMPEYSPLHLIAEEHGIDLMDPRLPASAGFVARVCSKSPTVSASFARFLSRCLVLKGSRRATVIALMSDPFIREHVSSAGADADRMAVSQWLQQYVPRAATSPALAQAAADIARARKVASEGSPTTGTVTPSVAAATLAPGAETPVAAAPQQRSASPPAKTAKVRAALSTLAAEPKPSSSKKVVVSAAAQSQGSVFADEPGPGVGTTGCCMWTSSSHSSNRSGLSPKGMVDGTSKQSAKKDESCVVA